jgi:hypothetical protein
LNAYLNMPIEQQERFPYRNELEMPVIGLESEFKTFVDDVEVVPEEQWRTPAAFIDQPLLRRTSKSSQLPTGGAVYFDGGVIEVVTPVIEIAPQCTARVVRSLWEQIGFVRDALDGWEKREEKRVRLQAFSCHFNISFELQREDRNRNRTIQKLALLLANLLPVPALVAGANRKSTGIGVRPRRDRIEITFDFTPDPGLMAAATALIVGTVREVISWPSYRVDELRERGLPTIDDVVPVKHATRKGWMTRDNHFPKNPFKADIDEASWPAHVGEDRSMLSMRDVALRIATYFRDSIRKYSDPFSYRLLFSVLRGDTPSLLDLDDRPGAYDDVGRTTRWGSVLPELENFAALMNDSEDAAARPVRRKEDVDEKLSPPWKGETAERRGRNRKYPERRMTPPPAPGKRLSRSAYENVFLQLGRGKQIRIGRELLTPVAVKGWYHSVFTNLAGEERMLSIDQLLEHGGGWQD